MKYLFLDVDGVLTNYFSDFELDERNLKNLKIFCDSFPKLTIVLISSWFLNDWKVKELNSAFKKYGIPVVNITVKDEFVILQHRGSAIAAFLEKNEINKSDIVIFDDEMISCCSVVPKNLLEPLEDRLVHINTHDGLTHTDLIKAWKMLDISPVIQVR